MTAPRVSFRPLEDGDRDRLLAWRNSPQVAAYMYSDHLITPEEHARWFAEIAGDPTRAYWIIEMDRTPVGLVNLYHIHSEQCKWAYYLADPATRGLGVGAWVEFRTLDHVFSDLGLIRLWCEVLADNEAVWNLHLSFGFKVTERLEDHVIKGGVPRTVLCLKLTKEGWAERREMCAARLATRGFDLQNPSPLG
jgi:UDP-4-amino-4,6-dideoxy-N-acetyl-beta-L-altrosamine N-acetyltransferase